MPRLIKPLDFDFIYGLYMHPQINPYLLYEPMEAEEFKPVFQDLVQKNIIYIYEDGTEAVGMFKFITQQYRNAHTAYLGGVAIHPAYAGKGHGAKMLNEIIQLGKLHHLKRIELSTAVTNARAIALYEKSGFAKEGIMKQYTWLKSENRYLDEVLMAYLYP